MGPDVDEKLLARFGQFGFDGFHDFWRIGFRSGGEASDDVAVATNHEFFKIPLDRSILSELLVQRCGFSTVDINFREQVERDIVFRLTEFDDFFFGPWFLSAELIAREANDG